MKRFLTLLLAACLASFALQAQNVFYLFPDYAEGEILFQGMSRPAKVKMNIDAIGQRVFYYQDDKLMELTNLDMVRTIKVGQRMFLMKDGLLCEALQDQARNDFTLFVNWKFRKVNVGSKGAMGATTQNMWMSSGPIPSPVTRWWAKAAMQKWENMPWNSGK